MWLAQWPLTARRMGSRVMSSNPGRARGGAPIRWIYLCFIYIYIIHYGQVNVMQFESYCNVCVVKRIMSSRAKPCAFVLVFSTLIAKAKVLIPLYSNKFYGFVPHFIWQIDLKKKKKTTNCKRQKLINCSCD